MKMQFNTVEEAEKANKEIGAEIQRRGRIENPKYVCSSWEIIEEVDGFFYLPFSSIATDLEIKYNPIEEL